MRLGLTIACLISAATLSTAAFADTSNFQITATGVPYTVDFSLDASTASQIYPGDYSFSNVASTINSLPDILEVDIFPATSGYTYLDFFDAGSIDESETLDPVALPFATPDPALTFHPGTYTGRDYTNCVAPPDASSPLHLFPTVAFFQLPVINSNCGDTFNLTVSTTPTVTPEPSTLALLGTGTLGVFGVLRRRLF